MIEPAYFQHIRQRASQRWDQLERDLELAGPWHQLFKQVQSPRHILSELLQNADDAGATEASVCIDDRTFIFEHNGEDFIEEHFASLCRFGYSNKRALHTIGFRGIGFKSTFSLGDTVELYTPTLAVSFNRRRFTEPKWLGSGARTDGKTCIRVAIRDQHRQNEVEKNLEEWRKSPVSLLFFQHIRRILIGSHDLHWGSLGEGPVPGSEWMALHENPDQTFLLLRSAPESFPEEALEEIKQERMLSVDENAEFPPCKIELVMGAKGHLFVVLPTGVETALSFACNAPFIQDPARLEIKSPNASPTNRWLLERTGKLAASAMLAWLSQPNMAVIELAGAYGLFPDVDRNDSSLEGICSTIVEESFQEGIKGQEFLLTNGGVLTGEQESVLLPDEICEVWPPKQAARYFDTKSRPPLCRYIHETDRQKLLNWGVVEKVSIETILQVVQERHLPNPNGWPHLLRLWTYISPEVTDYVRSRIPVTKLRIIPVQGKDVLYSASEVVRLGEKKFLHSEDDWEFLADYLIVLNQNWPRYLAEQRRLAEEGDRTDLQQSVNAAYGLLKRTGLEETSDVSKVIDRVAAAFFAMQNASNAEAVRLAQISAKLGATVTDRFQYVTRDCYRRPVTYKILFDVDGMLEELVPEKDRATRLLHPAYSGGFTSCTSEEWHTWVSSGRSGLFQFFPLFEKSARLYGETMAKQEAARRGYEITSFPYSSNKFTIVDWDFADSCWQHWEALSADDGRVWGRIAERIIEHPKVHWHRATRAELSQTATNGWTRSVSKELLPSWICKLRELPCLPDTRGFYHKPGELLRRSPETEALMDVEPFVHGRLDREETRPLLDILGVRCTPTSPDRLLDMLRALSKAEKPPVHEVERWYRRLDQLLDNCTTEDFRKIREAFGSEKLILTAGGDWATAKTVFLSANDEDVPDADVIRQSVEYLSLWRKIDVADQPTADLAIQWLQGLPSGNPLSPDDLRRVRGLLGRHPSRIWYEVGHWVNLAGGWVPVGEVSYGLGMQSLVAWGHLHEWVKQKTADIRKLSNETAFSPPFSSLASLASVLEERLHRAPTSYGSLERKEWLVTLGRELCRVQLEDEQETARTRELAKDLAETVWQKTPGLEIIPYLSGTPAGTSRRADVVWLDRILYVEDIPRGRLARRVPEEIGKRFDRPDIKTALDFSFERSPVDIQSYMAENFTLESCPEPVAEEPRTGKGEEADTKMQPQQEPIDESPGTREEESGYQPGPKEPEPSPGGAIDEEEKETPAEGQEKPPKQPRAEKPHRPAVIELFAKLEGYRRENDNRYFRADGRCLVKTGNDACFPWEMRGADGMVISYFLPKDHCLEQHPLQLNADVWRMIDTSPGIYALILTDREGMPVIMSGAMLRELNKQGKLKLYPATYRLVMESE